MSRSIATPALAATTLLCLFATSLLPAPTIAAQIIGTLSLEDPVTHLHTVDVMVGSSFKVELWARGIPTPGVVDFRVRIAWDAKFIGLVNRDINDHGFGVLAEGTDADKYEVELASPFPHSGFTNDALWATLTFRCLGEGSSRIAIVYSHGYLGNYGNEFSFSPEDATVSQHAAQSPAKTTPNIGTLWPWMGAVGVVISVAVAVLFSKNQRGRGEKV